MGGQRPQGTPQPRPAPPVRPAQPITPQQVSRVWWYTWPGAGIRPRPAEPGPGPRGGHRHNQQRPGRAADPCREAGGWQRPTTLAPSRGQGALAGLGVGNPCCAFGWLTRRQPRPPAVGSSRPTHGWPRGPLDRGCAMLDSLAASLQARSNSACDRARERETYP